MGVASSSTAVRGSDGGIAVRGSDWGSSTAVRGFDGGSSIYIAVRGSDGCSYTHSSEGF